MKTLIPSLVWVAALLSAAPARSADPEKTPLEIERLAKELVVKLGHPSYTQREAANQDLLELGVDALNAIEEGRRNEDAEIRTRCELLYVDIRTLNLKRRIEELAVDTDGRIANALPLGITYVKICGNDENARKFYFEICKNHLQRPDDDAKNLKTTGKAFIDLISEIESRGQSGLTPATECAALLLIAADEKIGPSIDEVNRKQLKSGDRNYQRFIGLLWSPKFEAALVDANNGRYFRKLLFAWAKRLPEPLAMSSFLFFVKDMIKKQIIKLDSGSDALEFLMNLAESTSSRGLLYHKGEAMSMVAAASFSNDDRMAFFEEKLFKDEALLPQVSFKVLGTKKMKYEARACDYALAICVKLSAQSMQDYGFDFLDPKSDAANAGWEYDGVTIDDTRKAAFKKYKEWRKANPIHKDEPKID